MRVAAETPAQADSPNLALQVLAVHSGGLVLMKSGDVAAQISVCAADAQDYYEVSFDAPDADQMQYHALQVKFVRTGDIARTGTEYYAGVLQSTAGLPAPGATGVLTTATGAPALKAQARLVIEDVTVADKNGHPIKGLSAADFVLREDNVPQKIASVGEHSALEEIKAAAPSDDARITAAGSNGSAVASNILPAGNVWNVVLIDLYNTPNEAWGRLQSQVEQFLKQLPERQPLALVTMLRQINIETHFEDGAGVALRYLRKNGLGPVDGSTPAAMVGRQDVLMPSADTTGSTIQNQANLDVDRQANRTQTTMNCFSELAQWLVDARGVAASDVAGVTSADSTYTANVAIVTAKDYDLSAARRSEMLEIAKATGGTAHFSNDIAQALQDEFNQANSYYTIAYTPPDKGWNGAYHRIQISIDKPAAQLLYREGYYAQSQPLAKPTPGQFLKALQFGAPSEHAVQFTSQLSKSGQTATVEYNIDPKTVDFQEDASGQFLTDIDFAIFEYGAKGMVLDKSLIELSGKMTAEQRAHLTSKALTSKQTIELKHGATNLVIGVMDRASGRFGTAEIPVKNMQ